MKHAFMHRKEARCFILHYSVLLHRHRDYLKYRNGKFCSLKRVSELHNAELANSVGTKLADEKRLMNLMNFSEQA